MTAEDTLAAEDILLTTVVIEAAFFSARRTDKFPTLRFDRLEVTVSECATHRHRALVLVGIARVLSTTANDSVRLSVEVVLIPSEPRPLPIARPEVIERLRLEPTKLVLEICIVMLLETGKAEGVKDADCTTEWVCVDGKSGGRRTSATAAGSWQSTMPASQMHLHV